MSRINVVTPETATAEQQTLFDAIHAQLGIVPNFLKVFVNCKHPARPLQFDF